MAIKWNSIVMTQPADGTTVWVRRLFEEDPVQATYSAATQEFTTASGFIIPAYVVSRWRDI